MEGIKEIDPEVDVFALNSSSIRNGFKLGDEPSVTPFEVLNCLNGINHKIGQIVVNEVTGRELIYMILDNFRFNKLNPERNTIIRGLKSIKPALGTHIKKAKWEATFANLWFYPIQTNPLTPIKNIKSQTLKNISQKLMTKK